MSLHLRSPQLPSPPLLPLVLLLGACAPSDELPALEASAGPDRVGVPGDSTFLDARDSAGEAITLRWTLTDPDGEPVDLGADATRAVLPLTLDRPGTWVGTVEVCDAWGRCVEDSALAIAADRNTLANNPPMPDAGPDQTVTLGDLVTLDGTSTFDLEGEIHSWNWAFTVLPSGSTLVNSDISPRTESMAWYTPDAQGLYTLRLKVDDGTDTAIDRVNITALRASNTAPTADAGADLSGSVGAAVSLTGVGADADGDTVSYKWALRSLPAGSALGNPDLAGRLTPTVSFTPDTRGTYELKLTVSDGFASSFDLVKVAAADGVNTAPLANAGADDNGSIGDTFTLDGRASSDPDGDSLTYRWAFDSVPAGSALGNSSIQDRFSALASFTPDVTGAYTLRLVADDGLTTGKDTVVVTVYTYDFHLDVRPIFTTRCATCHTGGTPPAGLNLNGSPHTSTVNVVSSQVSTMDLVEPGDSANSYLFHKVAGTHLSVGGTGTRMPKSGGALTTTQLGMIQTWIDEGAPN